MTDILKRLRVHHENFTRWEQSTDLSDLVVLAIAEIESLRAIAAEVRAQVEREIAAMLRNEARDTLSSMTAGYARDLANSILASDYPKEPTT